MNAVSAVCHFLGSTFTSRPFSAGPRERAGNSSVPGPGEKNRIRHERGDEKPGRFHEATMDIPPVKLKAALEVGGPEPAKTWRGLSSSTCLSGPSTERPRWSAGSRPHVGSPSWRPVDPLRNRSIIGRKGASPLDWSAGSRPYVGSPSWRPVDPLRNRSIIGRNSASPCDWSAGSRPYVGSPSWRRVEA